MPEGPCELGIPHLGARGALALPRRFFGTRDYAPPYPQELRAKRIGHVVVNTNVDRPWSQYFCCLVAGNREFVRKYPVATKRALRAMLKAADVCALEPDQAARSLGLCRKFSCGDEVR